jgi:NAD(P)-dependent dehydrogenase (short-subunit alcohol dehydrogenase family)
MGRIDGRTALVTGAASGIGAATAELLAREGAQVVAADLVPSSRTIALDVRSERSWDEALRGVGRLDLLVNCAGVSAAAPVADMTFEEWRRVLAVNLDGVFLGTRAGIRKMRAGGGGTIVNIGSMAGIDVHPGAAAYAASKAAMIHFSKVAAAECDAAGDGIRIHVLAPGGVRTPMWKSMAFWSSMAAQGEEAAWKAVDPKDEFHTAEEVAAALLDLVLTCPTSTVRTLSGRASAR